MLRVTLLPLPRHHPIRDLVVGRVRDDLPRHELPFVREGAVLDNRSRVRVAMPGSAFS